MTSESLERLDGENMMGELALTPNLSEDEVYERLDRIDREASQQGWRVALDWVWNGAKYSVDSEKEVRAS